MQFIFRKVIGQRAGQYRGYTARNLTVNSTYCGALRKGDRRGREIYRVRVGECRDVSTNNQKVKLLE